MRWPDFFIVGAPKAGTTSLYHYLKEHPDVFMPAEKEPNFFSSEELDQQKLYYNATRHRDTDGYLQLFNAAQEQQKIGEASVSYLYYPTVPAKIKAAAPDARILISLRDPVLRAQSHFEMDERLGYVKTDLKTIVDHPEQFPLFYQQYVRLGLYYEQVTRYLETFGSSRVKIILDEDLHNNQEDTLEAVFDFLGVNPTFEPTPGAHNQHRSPKNGALKSLYEHKKLREALKKSLPKKWQKRILDAGFPAGDREPMADHVATKLRSIFHKDIIALAEVTGMNLNAWLP